MRRSMLVPVMEVGIMRMGMYQPRMGMDVGVRFARGVARAMGVAVMQVVAVRVLMRQRGVLVQMLMPLDEMGP